MLYFTPAAIGYLTQLILAAAITVYLASRLRRTTRQMQTVLLTGFFAATTFFILLLFLDVALPPSQRLYAVFLENTATSLILIFLLQFAYHFPHLDPRKKWEARIALGFSIFYTLWEIQFAIFRFVELTAGHVYYRPIDADYALAAGFLWVPVVFIRQAIFADDGRVTWVRKLWQPRGEEAQAARAFALVFVVTLLLGMVNVLRGISLVSTAIYQLSLSVGLLLALFAFAVVYINSLPETTSFMVKLAGVMLTTLLTILAAVGWMITPVYAAQYHPPLSDRQTLRFTPNADGGYDVTHLPFQFDSDLGRDVGMAASDRMDSVPLDFTFPFFGRTSQTVYVTDMGIVSVGQALAQRDVQYRYGTTPAIFALGSFYAPEAGAGIFAKNEGDRLTITWSRLPGFSQRQAFFTFQLVLHRSGIFEITHERLPENLVYESDADPAESAWMVGAVPGDDAHPPQQVNFADVSLRSDSAGLVQDYYLDFRRYLHQLLSPLAYLILISLLITAGFPWLLYVGLVQPLNALLEGVRQVNAGHRAITMPIRHRDEIGFLTESFNGMIAQLHALVADLESRVAQRTADLQATNARLRQEIVEREEAQAQVMKQQRAVAALEEREHMGRELHDGLGQVMGYLNVQAQATETLVAKGDTVAVQANLRQMVRAAQDAHADLRNYILGLRILPVAPGKLSQTLEAYLRQFGETYNIAATLSYPTNAPTFPPAVEDQVLHIILEALANVRKHANARKVEVLFSFIDDHAQVIIADDGCGFDPHPAPSPVPRGRVGEGGHFGLNILRERAEQVGGHLEIRSAPGQGTKVLLTVPVTAVARAGDSDMSSVGGMRVLLVDDHPLFLSGLRNLLLARGITVIGTARDGVEAQEQARALHPDVIVMDIEMPRCNGLEATRAIKAERPETKIVMLTVSTDEQNLFEAIKCGASGYLLKSLDANEFCALLVNVMKGEVPLAPGLATRILSEFARREPASGGAERVPAPLTAQQWEILQMVARGMTYKEIGAQLHLAERTIKYHMSQILERLHLQTREQAIVYAGRAQPQ